MSLRVQSSEMETSEPKAKEEAGEESRQRTLADFLSCTWLVAYLTNCVQFKRMNTAQKHAQTTSSYTNVCWPTIATTADGSKWGAHVLAELFT